MKVFVSIISFLFLCSNSFSNTAKLGFAGDLMMSYEMSDFLDNYGPYYPFTGTEKIFRNFDFFGVNLECPVSDIGLPLQNKSFYFRAPLYTVKGLNFAGIDFVSLANNHILDFGDEAFFKTIEILSNNMIKWAGAGKSAKEANSYALFEIKGIKFAILSYNLVGPEIYFASSNKLGTATCDEKSMRSSISNAKLVSDHVIIFFHWGNEYSFSPAKEQIFFGHAAIDAGASAVIGCHSHVVQPVEIYKDSVIVYSMGNYVFGSFGRPPDKTADAGLIVELDFDKEKLKEVILYPINVFNYEVKFNPVPLPNDKAENLLKRITDDTWDTSEGIRKKNF